MEFKDIEKEVLATAKKYSRRCNFKIDEYFALTKLNEEMGEFAQAVLIHRKQCRPEKFLSKEKSKKEVAKELADVIGIAMVCADIFDIDLEEAINKKWISREWINEK